MYFCAGTPTLDFFFPLQYLNNHTLFLSSFSFLRHEVWAVPRNHGRFLFLRNLIGLDRAGSPILTIAFGGSDFLGAPLLLLFRAREAFLDIFSRRYA